MVLGKLDRYVQKNETRPPSYTIHKSKLKWIKDLNVSRETIIILPRRKQSKFLDISFCNIFSDILPRAKTTKEE